MTNNEAIRILTLERDDWETSHCTPMKRKEAFDMAINALTAQEQLANDSPKVDSDFGDLISRAAAQTELMMKCERYTLARESHGMGHVEWSDELIDLSDAMDAIRDLPSAQPETHEERAETHACDCISRKAAIDADRLLTDRMKSKYYHLPNGDIAIPIIDIEHAPTIDPESQIIYSKAGYIMSLHKEYGCTLTRAEEAHNKALEYLRDKAMMKG